VGAIGAAFFATEILGAPVAGRIADRTGQRRVLRWGPLFGVASAVLAASVALGPAPLTLLVALLFVARFNEGASAACAVPTTLTLLSRATDGEPERRTRIMGAFEVTSLVGMIAGYVVLGLAWDRWGAGAFLLLPPLYLLAWLLVDRRPGPRTASPGGTEPGVLAVLRRLADPANLAFGVAWLAINAVVGLWIQQAPFLLTLPAGVTDQLLVGGFSGREVGYIFGAWGLAFMAGVGLWSLLAPDWPRRQAMAVALVGMAGVVVVLTVMNHGGPGWLIWLAIAFVMVEAGFTPAAFAHLAEITVPLETSRATALGLYSVLLGAGQLTGNLLGSLFAARWQMDGVLALTALLGLAALLGVLRMSPADE